AARGPVTVPQPRRGAPPPVDRARSDGRREIHHGVGTARGGRRAAPHDALARGVGRRPLLLRRDPAVPREDLWRAGAVPPRASGRVDAGSPHGGVVRGSARLGAAPPRPPPWLPPAAQP